MWHILDRVSSCFPHFGPPSRTTARHLLAAARLSREAMGFDSGDVTPDDVRQFLDSKLQKRRRRGLRCFGGLLVAAHEDFGESLDKLRAEAEAARSAEERHQRFQEEQELRRAEAEEQEHERTTERQRMLKRLMHPESAITTAGCQVPEVLRLRLIRIGHLISPANVIDQVHSWKRCRSCRDKGVVGDVVRKTLAFCKCVAGEEARHQDPEGVARATQEVHSTARTRLVAASRKIGLQFPADAIEASEVFDDGNRVEIRIPDEFQLSLVKLDVEKALNYLGEDRVVVLVPQVRSGHQTITLTVKSTSAMQSMTRMPE